MFKIINIYFGNAIIIIMKDRSDLSGLYPNTSQRTDNMNNQAKYVAISRKADETPMVYQYYPIVAALITAPVTLFVLLINLLRDDLNSGSFDLLFPVLLTSLVLGGFFSVIVYSAISKRFERIGVENSLFLLVYTLSGLPIAQLIYDIFNHYNLGVVNPIPFTISIFFENLIVVTVIITLMKTKKLSGRTKIILFAALAIFCVAYALSTNK